MGFLLKIVLNFFFGEISRFSKRLVDSTLWDGIKITYITSKIFVMKFFYFLNTSRMPFVSKTYFFCEIQAFGRGLWQVFCEGPKNYLYNIENFRNNIFINKTPIESLLRIKVLFWSKFVWLISLKITKKYLIIFTFQ